MITDGRKILEVGIGQSTDPTEAIEEALEGCRKPDLTIVFASSDLDPNEVYREIKEKVGNSHIIGGTTAGEFSSAVEKPQKGTVAVMTLKSPYLKVGVGVGEGISKNPFECGKEAISKAYASLKDNPTASAVISIAFMKKKGLDLLKMKPFVNIILPDGLAGVEEEFIKGIVSAVGCNQCIIGGSTGDDLKFKRTYQFGNGVYTDAGVVATLSSALKIGTGYGHPFYPTDAGAVITKSKGRVVYELDGRPASEVMRDLLEVDELTPEIFSQTPVGVKSSDVYGEYIIKSPANVKPDGSITFYSEVPTGCYLTIMDTDKEHIIESFKRTILNAIEDAGDPEEIGAIVIFNCILRHLLTEREGINDLKIIKELVGDVPVIGFNTYGEQGSTLGGSIGHYNQTSTVLLLSNEVISR
ncbi:FIST signal transduction protein [Methanofervidicoccus sp. A16]|uniref:FIST signal transduction protein n=1 Tax=Methanofervidicoccus sp. A16 TaxID=2607662 RepID=UPI0015595523|nr:FIST N-terminal domain-containing protein [Methanofervidicoccus sp. A16]